MSLIPFAGAVQKFNRSGGGGGGAAGYQIERSLRLNYADSSYLNRTPGSSGNRQKWTVSLWTKRSALASRSAIIGAGNSATGGGSGFGCRFESNTGVFTWFSGGATTSHLISTAYYRDPSSWYHVVISVDTTQATSSNRVRVYINNEEITSWSTNSQPSENYSFDWNHTVAHYIGAYDDGGPGTFLSGYIAEIHNVDGQQLTPSSFGEFNATTGVWQPKAYTGSYGTNGFYLDFANNTSTTTLGYDAAGSNDWSTSGFSVTAGKDNDSLVDSPTRYGTDTGVGGEVRGNYATLNPLDQAGTLSNGNLDISTTSASWTLARGTVGVSSGKWYFEATLVSGTNRMIGISKLTGGSTYPGSNADGWGYAGGTLYNNGSGSSYGASFTNGDVVGVALDLDAGTLVFYKNGSSQGTAATGLTGTWFPCIAVYAASGTTLLSLNAGQRPFAYTAPSGFKALCTTNLPEPTIADGGDYFNAVEYLGDGADQSVPVGFQPDWIWIKNKSAAYSHVLQDAVRGFGTLSKLATNSTNAEGTSGPNGDNYGHVSSVDADGFTLTHTINGSDDGGIIRKGTHYLNDAYVAWNWNAGGSTVTNTSGTVSSQVRANPTAGFSIVTWSQGASNQTVGHGLGVTPAMIIGKTKSNGGFGWHVFHQSLGVDKYIFLNLTNAAATSSGIWSTLSSTTFGASLGLFETNQTQVAYCFASVAGYSAFGSYAGNGSTDGPFVYTDFRPAFVMIKQSSASGENWGIIDSARDEYNVSQKQLLANSSTSESITSNAARDFTANGFKLRTSHPAYNGSGATYIYAAFAENPFAYALAR